MDATPLQRGSIKTNFLKVLLSFFVTQLLDLELDMFFLWQNILTKISSLLRVINLLCNNQKKIVQWFIENHIIIITTNDLITSFQTLNVGRIIVGDQSALTVQFGA